MEENIFVIIVFKVLIHLIKILKNHTKYCFKINGKQKITMPKNVNILN